MEKELNLSTDFDYTQEQKDAFEALANSAIFADVTVNLNGNFIGGRPKDGRG